MMRQRLCCSVSRHCFAERLVAIIITRQRQHGQPRRSSSSLGSVLILSSLYPQPSASAAGVRTNYMIQQLCHDGDWRSIHYATGAAASDNKTVENLVHQGVKFHSIPPNQSLKMKQMLDGIPDLSLVVFDRFYTEEAYSFHLYNHSPDAVRVLDMQDFHSLRQGRMELVKELDSTSQPWDNIIAQAKQHTPSHLDSMLLRELASIHRSDLTLVCSAYEYHLLENTYDIATTKLCMAPFWVSQCRRGNFAEKRDFCFVGGFRHAPNVDAVQQLANHIWPRIRQTLPEAQLHIYGAYCPPSIQALHKPSTGFLVHGFVESLDKALLDKRVMLAPLRYGAGIKGKIIDAWMYGMPVVTTCIGSEGITQTSLDNIHEDTWGGIVADNIDDFANGAIELYTNKDTWKGATETATAIISEQFEESQFNVVSAALKNAVRNRQARRSKDYVGSILWHQTTRSTEYFSRWIECKESKKP